MTSGFRTSPGEDHSETTPTHQYFSAPRVETTTVTVLNPSLIAVSKMCSFVSQFESSELCAAQDLAFVASHGLECLRTSHSCPRLCARGRELTSSRCLRARPMRNLMRRTCIPSMRAVPGMPSFGPPRAAEPGEVSALMARLKSGDASERLQVLLATRNLYAADAAPIICKMLDDGEESMLVRGFACLFLAYKPNSRSASLLTGVIENGRETPEVVSNAVAALGYLRDPAAIPICLRLLRNSDTHWSTRSTAAVSIGIIAEAVPSVRQIVYDDLIFAFEAAEKDDPVLAQALVGALGDTCDLRCVGKIGKYLGAEDFPMAQCVCEALSKLPCEESIRLLQGVIENGENVHVNVLWSAEIALKAVQDAMR